MDYQISDSVLLRQSYTYTKSEQKSGENKGQPLNNVSEHMYNASIEWQASEQLLLWTQGNYRSESSGDESGEDIIPSYTLFDAGLAYKIKKDINLKAGIYNLFNKEINPEEDESYIYILDGRKYNLALTVRF